MERSACGVGSRCALPTSAACSSNNLQATNNHKHVISPAYVAPEEISRKGTIMHAKPLHIIVFFILIGPAALIAQATGLGTDGLFIAILLIGAVVIVVPWLFRQAMHSFGDCSAFLEFMLAPP